MITDDLIYEGPPIDDEATLERLPDSLRTLLRTTNGFLSMGGGFHLRGACLAPDWHSLAVAWDGPKSFCHLYQAVGSEDVPFAEDCVGDQFLLRKGAVLRLDAELGELEEVAPDLDQFWKLISDEPELVIATGALQSDAVADLVPGSLLHVVPPYCLESEAVRSVRAIDSMDLRDWHASLAEELCELPDGSTVQFKPLG